MNTKKIAGEKAVEFVKDGMILGLGTGSTVYWSILKIGELVQDGLQIRGIPTSKNTENLANELGIPLLQLSEVDQLDLAIDGADEANPAFQLIKGGGGALLREKMIASIAKQFIVVADESKYVNQLGKFPLPVEVVQFGWELTFKKISKIGGNPVLRKLEDGTAYVSDNGNYILDCYFEKIVNPQKLHTMLNMIPGVVENGLFINLADTLIIGKQSGEIEMMDKSTM